MGTPLIRDRSELTLPRHILDGAESAFLVGKRAPLDRLPKVLAELARKTYFKLGSLLFGGIEGLSICTSKQLADDFASRPGRFVLELPVDECLPDELVQFGYHNFPASQASPRYLNRRFKFTVIDIEQFKALAYQVSLHRHKVLAYRSSGSDAENS